MTEARLTHWNFFINFPGHLFLELELRDVLVLGQWWREVVQELEAMIMGLVYWERWSLCLLVEVYETCWTRLNLSLVVSVDSTELRWVYSVIMHHLFALSMASWRFKSVESVSSSAINVFLIFFRKEFFVLPHFVQYARASFRCRVFNQRRLFLKIIITLD